MNFKDLLELGASAIQTNSDDATTSLDSGVLVSALGSLFAGKDGKPDFSALLENMKQSGLGEIAASWLGSGPNEPVSGEAVRNLLGPDTIEKFASQLGISGSSAEGAIADALPAMVDKASPDGSLLEDIFNDAGGLDGLIGLARKFF